jgi:hypothetical protein
LSTRRFTEINAVFACFKDKTKKMNIPVFGNKMAENEDNK